MRQCTLGLAIAAALMAAPNARAGLIPGAVTVTPDGSNYRYKYNVHLPSDYTVTSGDFFTIYDFNGFAGGPTVQPAGWSFSSTLLGPNPPQINPTESGALANLTWTYGGPDLTSAGSLGLFEALSSLGPHTVDGVFASQDHRSSDGRPVGNYTIVSVPDADMPDAPEPASLVLLALGLPLAGLAARVARRRRAA